MSDAMREAWERFHELHLSGDPLVYGRECFEAGWRAACNAAAEVIDAARSVLNWSIEDSVAMALRAPTQESIARLLDALAAYDALAPEGEEESDA